MSNRFFDLFPVVGRLAETAGLVTLGRVSSSQTDGSQTDGSLPSSAVVLGTEGPSMEALRARGWRALPSASSLCTDDCADVLGAL